MSTVEKVGTQVGNTCVGAVALMLGDASGGALTAQGLVGLAALGAALRGQSAKRACINAQGAVIAALTAAPEFRTANLDRLMTLLESESAPFSRADLIAASNDAKDLDLDAALARKLHASFDFDGDDAATKRVLFLALEAGIRACNTDQEFKQDVRSVQTLQILQDIAQMKQTLAQVVTHVQTKSDLSLEARELARQEKLIHRIAEKYVEARPEDPLKALEGIEAALERLSNDIARDRRGSNFDKDFDEMIAEVDRLILEEGALDEAGQTLGRAKDDLVDRRRELAAEEKRIVEKQITVASLRNDPEAAASHYVELIALDADRPASVDEIQARALALGDEYRTNGNLFDGRTALALLETAYQICGPEDGPDVVLGNLANAASSLGERDSRPEFLHRAIALFHEHLAMVPRQLLPTVWATTQNNLGNALADLGTRAGDTDALQDAVTAYRAALEVFTRAASPMDWAMTQNNLGAALADLGTRAGDTDALQDAVTAFRAALEVRTREASPMHWAMTQNNLGNALRSLGTCADDTDALQDAITAYRAALEVRTREASAMQWAMTQNNLGNALAELGKRAGDTDALQDAITACRAALEVFTREATPYQHALTMETLAMALHARAILADTPNRRDDLAAAREAVDDALTIYTPEHTPYHHDKATSLRKAILAAMTDTP